MGLYPKCNSQAPCYNILILKAKKSNEIEKKF